MATDDDRPSRCNGCGTPLTGLTTVDVTVSDGDQERSTALCEDCATVACVGCGHDVPLARALAGRDDIWEVHDLYECTRCEASVPASDIVELRHQEDASYRKRVCAECLQEVPIPGNIRVIRDVS